MRGEDDALVRVQPLLDMTDDWQALLGEAMERQIIEELRRHERTGRPLGEPRFIKEVERITGRLLSKMKPGRKPRSR